MKRQAGSELRRRAGCRLVMLLLGVLLGSPGVERSYGWDGGVDVGVIDAMRFGLPDLGPAVAGMWNIREIYQAGRTESDARVAAEHFRQGLGEAINYRLPVINLSDPGFSRGIVPGSDAFASNDLQGPLNSDDDHFSTYGQAHILVREPGLYTFGFHGDDGGFLRIKGQEVVSSTTPWFNTLSHDGEAHAGDTIAFGPIAAGSTHTYGVWDLKAGVYEIDMLHTEGGGEAYIEVFAAKGAYSTYNPHDFRLVGHQEDGSSVKVSRPGMAGQWTVFTSEPDAHGAITNLATGLSAATSGELVKHDFINFHDPGYSSAGRIPGDIAFDTNTTGDDDNFGVFAFGLLEIAVADTYHIGFQSDDGAWLRIEGAVFSGLTENVTGMGVIDDGGRRIRCDCLIEDSSTVGEVFLTAGTYPIEVVFFERGGDSSFEVFGWGSNSGPVALTDGGAMGRTVRDFAVVELVGEFGDADGDGDVDNDDYAIWRMNFGEVVGDGAASGDFNWDGAVDGFDLSIWQSHYGQGQEVSGDGLVPIAIIPEPAMCFFIGFCGVLMRRG